MSTLLNLEEEDVQTFLNRLGYLFEQKLENSTIELECRIWQYKYFNTQTLFNPNQASSYNSKRNLFYSVDGQFWEHTKRRLFSQTDIQNIEQSTDIVYKNGDVRKIVLLNIQNQPLHTIYEVKKNKMDSPNDPIEIITEYSNDRYVITPIRIGISDEKQITEQEVLNYTSYPSFKEDRKRIRTSFYFPNKKNPKFRIDFTDCTYKSSNVREFQLEIEYLNFTSILQTLTKKDMYTIFRSFIPIFFESLKHIYPQIQSFSTVRTYENISSCIPSRGLAPINIQTSHINGGCYDMWVTNKLDGVAYSLFIHIYTLSSKRKKCIIFLRNDKDLWIINKFKLETIESEQSEQLDKNKAFTIFSSRCEEFNGTQLRCEVVKNQIHIFDILTYKSSNEPIPSFSDKLNICKVLYQVFHQYYSTLKDPPFQFFLKDFYKTQQIENDIQKVCQSMYIGASKNINKMTELNDGVIFQPNNTFLSPLKWKFFKNISIDFKYKKSFQNNVKVSYKLQLNNDEYFKIKDPNTNQLNDVEVTYKIDAKIESVAVTDLENLIIECGWNSEKKIFRIMRIRWDKTRANSSKTAYETYFDMIHERTLPMLIREIKAARLSLGKPYVVLKENEQYSMNQAHKSNLMFITQNEIQTYFPSIISSQCRNLHLPFNQLELCIKNDNRKAILDCIYASFFCNTNDLEITKSPDKRSSRKIVLEINSTCGQLIPYIIESKLCNTNKQFISITSIENAQECNKNFAVFRRMFRNNNLSFQQSTENSFNQVKWNQLISTYKQPIQLCIFYLDNDFKIDIDFSFLKDIPNLIFIVPIIPSFTISEELYYQFNEYCKASNKVCMESMITPKCKCILFLSKTTYQNCLKEFKPVNPIILVNHPSFTYQTQIRTPSLIHIKENIQPIFIESQRKISYLQWVKQFCSSLYSSFQSHNKEIWKDTKSSLKKNEKNILYLYSESIGEPYIDNIQLTNNEINTETYTNLCNTHLNQMEHEKETDENVYKMIYFLDGCTTLFNNIENMKRFCKWVSNNILKDGFLSLRINLSSPFVKNPSFSYQTSQNQTVNIKAKSLNQDTIGVFCSINDPENTQNKNIEMNFTCIDMNLLNQTLAANGLYCKKAYYYKKTQDSNCSSYLGNGVIDLLFCKEINIAKTVPIALGFNNLYRIPTIADGSCFYYCILENTYNDEYLNPFLLYGEEYKFVSHFNVKDVNYFKKNISDSLTLDYYMSSEISKGQLVEYLVNTSTVNEKHSLKNITSANSLNMIPEIIKIIYSTNIKSVKDFENVEETLLKQDENVFNNLCNIIVEIYQRIQEKLLTENVWADIDLIYFVLQILKLNLNIWKIISPSNSHWLNYSLKENSSEYPTLTVANIKDVHFELIHQFSPIKQTILQEENNNNMCQFDTTIDPKFIGEINPSFEQEQIQNRLGKKFILISDHLFGGSKTRLLSVLANEIDQKELVYAGPDSGMAQIAIGGISKLYNKKATLFINTPKELAEKQPLVEFGLSYLDINYDYSPNPNEYRRLREMIPAAEEYVNTSPKNRKLLPFGLDSEEYITIFTGLLKKALSKINPPKRCWVVAGSGTVLTALQRIWPNTSFQVVQVGKEVSKEKIRSLDTLYIYKQPFRQQVSQDEMPPYKTIPWYDAKLWKFVESNGEEGDYIYNVAILPTYDDYCKFVDLANKQAKEHLNAKEQMEEITKEDLTFKINYFNAEKENIRLEKVFRKILSIKDLSSIKNYLQQLFSEANLFTIWQFKLIKLLRPDVLPLMRDIIKPFKSEKDFYEEGKLANDDYEIMTHIINGDIAFTNMFEAEVNINELLNNAKLPSEL